jgi:hypothetical protein
MLTIYGLLAFARSPASVSFERRDLERHGDEIEDQILAVYLKLGARR